MDPYKKLYFVISVKLYCYVAFSRGIATVKVRVTLIILLDQFQFRSVLSYMTQDGDLLAGGG